MLIKKAKLLGVGACALILSGCMLSPGQSLDTSNAKKMPAHIGYMPKPTIVAIDLSTIHHASKAHDCIPNNKGWLCNHENRYEYLVGPQDVLSVIVWNHPELTNPEGNYRSTADTGILVNSEGTIFFPFAGTLEVAGNSVEKIRQTLTVQLAKYIQDPQISVRVAGFNSQRVQVMGEIKLPKTEAVTNTPLNLIDAINNAGGIDSSTADAKYVYVIRGPVIRPTLFWLNANKPDALLLAEQFYLRNGDVVYVSTAPIARWQRVISAIFPTFEAGSAGRSATS